MKELDVQGTAIQETGNKINQRFYLLQSNLCSNQRAGSKHTMEQVY